MTPGQLYFKYVGMLPTRCLAEFADDLVSVVKHERDRQRRQLCTDPQALEAAREETLAEIQVANHCGVKDHDGHC